MLLLDIPDTLDNNESDIKLSTKMLDQGKPLIGAGSEIAFLKKLLNSRVISYPTRDSICPVETTGALAEYIITQKKLNQANIQKAYYIYDKNDDDKCVGLVTITPINSNTVKIAQITTYKHTSNWHLLPMLEDALTQTGRVQNVIRELPANTIDNLHLLMLKHQGYVSKRPQALFDESRLTFTHRLKVASQSVQAPVQAERTRCA